MSTLNNSDLLSALLDEPSNALLRKFDSLGFSLLVRLQTELTAIEERGFKTALVTHINLHKGETTESTFAPEESQEEKQLLTELQHKLTSYYKLLDLYLKVQSFKTIHPASLDSFRDFLENRMKAQIENTSWSDGFDLLGPFTNHLPERDLLTMKLADIIYKYKGTKVFDWVVDILPRCIHRRIVRPANPEFENADALLYNLEGVSDFLSWLVVLIAPTFIVAPMFVLYAIPSTWGRMAGLWFFSTIFAAVIRLLAAGADSGLIFAITAAFCAVLVVFVGSALPSN